MDKGKTDCRQLVMQERKANDDNKKTSDMDKRSLARSDSPKATRKNQIKLIIEPSSKKRSIPTVMFIDGHRMIHIDEFHSIRSQSHRYE
jgi:hypothetical protein